MLDILDELGGWDLGAPVLLADCGHGQVGQFLWGLEVRGVGYVVEVRADTSAYPEQVHPPSHLARWTPRGPFVTQGQAVVLAERALQAAKTADQAVARGGELDAPSSSA